MIGSKSNMKHCTEDVNFANKNLSSCKWSGYTSEMACLDVVNLPEHLEMPELFAKIGTNAEIPDVNVHSPPPIRLGGTVHFGPPKL